MARQRNGKWQADAIVAGKRVRPCFDTLAQAQAFEQSASCIGSAGEGTIGVAFLGYAQFLWAESKDYKGALQITNDLIRRLGPSTNVCAINDASIDDMIETMIEEGLANQTINNKLTRLSKLLKRAKRKKILPAMPTIELRPTTQGRLRFLSPQEEAHLFDAMQEKDRRFCEFLLYTGCRFSEAVKLRWTDVGDDIVSFYETKSNKARSVPLARKAQEALKWAGVMDLPAKQPTLLTGLPRASTGLSNSCGSGPFAWVSYMSFRQRWKTARAKAGLGDDDQVIPHVLRHTCASRLVQRGIDIRRVKDFLGHASINTTMRYAHLAPSDLVTAARALEAA